MTDRLQVLIAEYEAAREDDRSHLMVQATLLGLAVAVLGVLIGVLTQSCEVSGSTECTTVPQPLLAAAPLAPLALLGYMQGLGSQATVRSFYMRQLEREIRAELLKVNEAVATTASRPTVSLLATTEMAAAMGPVSTGHRVMKPLISLVLGGVLLVFGGLALYIAVLVDWPLRLLMLLVYGGGALLILSELYRATVGGRRLYASVADEVGRRVGEDLQPRVTEERPRRSLGSYLVLPRPDDLIKAAFFPAFYLLGRWLAADANEGPLLVTALPAVVFWLALELLIYQARYQWNDIRGLRDDMAHPEARRRGRLPADPENPEPAIRLSLAVMGLRLYLVLVLATIEDISLGWPLLWATVAVFGVAVAYEAARWRSRDSIKLAGGEQLNGSALWLSRIIVITVGFGYVVRGLFGLVLAGPSLGAPTLLVVALFLWAFGVVFVTLTWTLESASFLLESPLEPDGSVSRRAVPYLDTLEEKSHLYYLAESAGIRLGERTSVPAAPARAVSQGAGPEESEGTIQSKMAADRTSTPGSAAAVLRRRGRIPTWWNACLLVGAVAGAAVAVGLGTGASAVDRDGAILGAVALVGSFALVLANSTAARVVVLLAGGVGLGGAALLGGTAIPVIPLLAVASWAAVAGVYVAFRNTTYREMKSFGSNASKALQGSGLVASAWVRGEPIRPMWEAWKAHSDQGEGR